MKIVFYLLFLILFADKIFAQSGILSGKVIDNKTKEPLLGVNLQVNEIKNTGTTTDSEGQFKLKLPVGSYSITFSMIGYTSVVETDVIIKSGAEAKINLSLAESAYQLEGMTVKADYFNKAVLENDISTLSLGVEEIRRSPGSSQDFQRILQGMAGVSFSNDQNNELLVRGGAPDENLTVYDNIEIHSTNHYPNQYNSGGPINMINVDLIEDIQFSTGGFISKYGDKLSSVQVIESREGTRERFFKGNANISMAGYGAILEGSFNEKGSWILSARKSYINLIAGSFGLTSIPYYYDFQFKTSYDISSKQKILLSGLYGNDKIFIEGDSELEDIKFAGKIADTLSLENIDVDQEQYVIGLTLKSFWNKNFYSLFTVSNNSYNSKIDVTGNLTERYFDNKGKKTGSRVLKSIDNYIASQQNGETTFRAEFNLNTFQWNEINFGAALKFVNFKTDEKISGDTVRYDFNNDNIFDTVISIGPAHLNYDFSFPKFSKSYFYINNRIKIFNERLIFNIGLRYDYFSYSSKGNLSPRFSASYFIIPLLLSVNFAYGEYYQIPSIPLFGDRNQSEVNRFLENSHSRHFVSGFEYIIDNGLKLNVEGYYKKYDKMPIDEDFINFNDRKFRSEKILTIGRQDVFGIDLFLQQKLVKELYGTICFSRMWNTYFDPRIGFEGKTYPGANDYPYVFNIIIGQRFNNLRDKLDQLPAVIKYLTYILPFSNDMEISAKWRYASGRPYSGQRYTINEQHLEDGLIWGKGVWISEDIYSQRYPDYHRLDIGFNSRFNYENWNISLFLSIQNLYNQKNISNYIYNSDGTIDTVYQFSFLPIVGLEIQF